MTDKSLTNVRLNYPMFIDQVEPKGRLTIDRRCHACWYYYMLADKADEKVGGGIDDQVIVHDAHETAPEWMERRYHQIAKSVATLYGLDSPEDFLSFFPLVILELNRIGYQIKPQVMSPFGVGLLQ